ncbi:MAG: hypothetical protein EPN47_10775 [Acidobacteria bacterium]|nr:MAG: hypothetical protein EPN47_10775 [Acidobacteriota bacterium]
MRSLALLIALGLLTPCTLAAQTPGQEATKPASETAPPEQIETEKIKVPENMQSPPRSMANQPGYMEPAQTHQLLVKLWQAEARVNDLVTQIRPEELKMAAVDLDNFNNDLKVLRGSLAYLEESRQIFDRRVDSEYLGFETYAGISEVLPLIERLTRTISRHNNPSLEGEFNQSWNDMLTMRQSLKPYLSFLLRNHDQIFVTMEANLAGCQNELGYKNYKANGSATNMRNVLPEFKGRRVHKKAESSEGTTKDKP